MRQSKVSQKHPVNFQNILLLNPPCDILNSACSKWLTFRVLALQNATANPTFQALKNLLRDWLMKVLPGKEVPGVKSSQKSHYLKHPKMYPSSSLLAIKLSSLLGLIPSVFYCSPHHSFASSWKQLREPECFLDYSCNPSPGEAAGGSPWVRGQARLHSSRPAWTT